MKKILLIVVFLTAFAKAYAQSYSIDTYHRAEITLKTSHSLEHLQALGIAADHGILKKNKVFISDFSTRELEIAREHGYSVHILIPDVQTFYKNQNVEIELLSKQQNPSCDDSATTYETPENFKLGSMGGYLTYQELLDELDEMVSQYPDLITTKTPISDFLTEGTPNTNVSPSIGSNPIYWVKISDNPNTNTEGEEQVLYTSLHHAREPMSLMQLVFYMWYLLENYESDTEIQAIVNSTELYFIPVVNPDGYLFNQLTDPNGGGLWRKNRNNGNGVDNNRNYNYHINGDPNNSTWGGPGSSSNPNSMTYHGEGPFSEIENQAIKWFVEQHDFVLAFNNHTFGELFYYPFGYADVATPDDNTFEQIGAQISSKNNYTALRDSPFAGDSDDFMYGTVGTHEKIFAFTPEIGNSFWPPASSIIPTSIDMMYANITMAQMANNYAAITDTSNHFVQTTNANASFDLQRLGINGSGTFTVSIEPITSNIIDTQAPQNFALELLETNSGSISYTLSSDILDGESISYNLVVNNGSYSYTIPVTKTFGELTQIFYDSGDSITAQFETNDWEVTNTTFVSPSSSITDSSNGNYNNNVNSAISISQPIDLTIATAASVGYFARWNIEDSWDYVQFEISIDGGNSWEPQCGTFTTIGSNNQPTGEPVYDGTQEDWVREDIDLSNYLGETIFARFRLVTDETETRDGFYFDDLEFSVIYDSLGQNDLLFQNAFTFYPNPMNNTLFIQTTTEMYTVRLISILGQEIESYENLSGNSQIDVNLLASGIYFVELSADDKRNIFKLLKE